MAITPLFLYFICYSFLGWCCESIYKSIFQREMINSGFLNGPICPVYGFGAIAILYLLQPFKNSWILVFLFGMLTTSIIEYLTSWILEVLFHMSWWDYSKYKFNLHGRVCLLNSTMFGILSLIVTYLIHPIITKQIASMSKEAQWLIAAILFLFLIIDLIVTVSSLLGMNRSLSKIHEYLHTVFENAAANMNSVNEKISSENEIIIQKLLKKREHLKKAFPDIKHTRFDISGKSISELIVKKRKEKKKQ